MKLDLNTKNDNHDIQNLIISKIRNLINHKNLEPGDKLPSERVLSEKFGVSRRHVREAIQKLELYELVESIPQSGTFVANIGQTALNGIINDILRLRRHDFKSLVETRILLELRMVELAAKRRTEEDLKAIETTFDAYKAKVVNREDALQEDLLFHLAIARASGNTTMNALLLQITPNIINVFETNRVCKFDDNILELQKHQAIFEAIAKRDSAMAIESMETHFDRLMEFCNRFENQVIND
ncbi:FadR family transcriptional regulator [Neolewinella aurantiaca]|uniref:FadR family transcriptional regulator n=1 Tax=Neolewinella aurantiaca TaxID=2602767 RepID=A0A5C7FVV1_9BACT|nr:FadR family transcriptional regulator [Neolewinella aurantiaca]